MPKAYNTIACSREKVNTVPRILSPSKSPINIDKSMSIFLLLSFTHKKLIVMKGINAS